MCVRALIHSLENFFSLSILFIINVVVLIVLFSVVSLTLSLNEHYFFDFRLLPLCCCCLNNES